MRDPANDHEPLLDADDAEEARVAARYAKIKHAAQDYIGRANLLELGISVARELRAAHTEIKAARGKAPEVLARVVAKSDELAAIEEAMDDATKVKLWDVIARLPGV